MNIYYMKLTCVFVLLSVLYFFIDQCIYYITSSGVQRLDSIIVKRSLATININVAIFRNMN